MGYAIIFFANVAISTASELIERRRCRLVFLIDQRLFKGDNSYAGIVGSCLKITGDCEGIMFFNYMIFNILKC